MGHILGVIEAFVDVHGVIDHVSLVEELDLGFENLVILIQLAFLEEFEERENEMPVEVGRDARGEIVKRH